MTAVKKFFQKESTMLSSDQVSGKVLDHLGLISAVIDKVGLIDKVDKRLPVSKAKGAHVTMGERLAAMILNGLGFMDDRLYMFSEFLTNKPVERLFSPGVQAEHFTDDALGRCLDAIYEYGPTKLFSEIAFDIGTSFNLLGKTARFDTTSLSVYGQYDETDELKSCEAKDDFQETHEPFHITHGYSKDGRPDLKQMILNLATTGKASFPIWMASHSGNSSDKVVLHQAAERMKKFADALKNSPSFLFVGDSAMYEKCVEKAGNLLWLSRVPHTSNRAKKVLTLKDKDVKWTDLDKKYRISPIQTSTKGERWLLVFSQQAYDREVITLDKKIVKEEATVTKELWHLGNEVFSCKADAQKAIKSLQKKLQYHTITPDIEEVRRHASNGRPKKDAVASLIGCRIIATVTKNEAQIAQYRLQKGRFILATNQLDKTQLSDENMLKEYKDQIHTEAGFRFIKGDAFEVSSVFLKKKTRIQALMMVMTLCLMIYNLAQHFLRSALQAKQDTVPNQLKKPTDKPTMAWVCRLFHGVQVWHVQFEAHTQELVVNVTEVRRKIIQYFGEYAERIYGLSEQQRPVLA